MTFIKSVVFNDNNTSAGIPITDRLSVPLGLVCVKRQIYDNKHNILADDVICDIEFDSLAKRAQHIGATRKNRANSDRKTKKVKLIKYK